MDSMKFKVVYDFSINPSKSNFTKFHDFLVQCPIEHLKVHYPIFFNSLFTELRKISERAEDCISELASLLHILINEDNNKIFLIVFEEMSNFIQNYINKKSKGKSEDDFDCINIHLAINIMKIFNIILTKFGNNKNERFIYSSSGLLLLGYIVSFILHFVNCYKERDVQIEALLVLTLITDYKSRCLVEKANVVVNFAPGVLKSLLQVIQSDWKVGSIVKSRALKCFGNLIVLIYGDKSFERGNNKLNVSNEIGLIDIVVERSAKWKENTWGNVHSMIKLVKYSLLGRTEEEHWKVRLELVKMSKVVLEECRCVGQAAVDLIDCLIVLSADKEIVVRKEANDTVVNVANMNFTVPVYWNGDEENFSLVPQTGALLLSSVVRDNIDNVIGAMQRLQTTLTDDGKCKILQVLDGYLNIYESHNLGSLSCAHLHAILTHLVSFCTLDYRSIDLLEATLLNGDILSPLDSITDCELINKTFVYFNNDKVFTVLKSVISSIVNIVKPALVLSILSSLNVDNQSSIVLIARMIVMSLCYSKGISAADKVSICKSLLTRYFDNDFIYLPTVNESESDSYFTVPFITAAAAIERKIESSHSIVKCTAKLTPSSLKQNALLLSLIMELCAACAICIGNCELIDNDIESWIMRTCIFEVMSKAQQSPSVLSHSASSTLRLLTLTAHTKYGDCTASLIRQNSDYIMDAVARRLRSVVICLKTTASTATTSANGNLDSTCRCLVTLCRHADMEVLPFLSVVLDQLLLCLDMTRQGPVQWALVSVLEEMVGTVTRWTGGSLVPLLAISDSAADSRNSVTTKVDIVRSFLIDRDNLLVSSGLRRRRRSSSEDDIVEKGGDDDGGDGQKTAVVMSPSSIVVTKIIDRCIHLSASQSARVRLQCLRVINKAVCCLQRQEDCLNQLVHRLWAPLEHRLGDREFPVVLEAFELLNSLSQLSGSFLRTKISAAEEGLVSRLCRLLGKDCVQSTWQRYSGLCKLQRSLLHFLATLAVRTGLEGPLLEQLVDVFLLYLDDRLGRELNDVCAVSLIELFKHNVGLVWFKVTQMLPIKGELMIGGQRSIKYDSHFTNNLQKLLHDFTNIY